VCVYNDFNARKDNEKKSGCHEDSNDGEEGEGGFRRRRYQETEYYTPMFTYPSNVGDELLWEGITNAMTLERCSGVKSRLKNYLRSLNICWENKQILEIVLYSLKNFMDVYQKMGLTIDSFINLMRRRKLEVMGPNK